jgi:hypothetical protein
MNDQTKQWAINFIEEEMDFTPIDKIDIFSLLNMKTAEELKDICQMAGWPYEARNTAVSWIGEALCAFISASEAEAETETEADTEAETETKTKGKKRRNDDLSGQSDDTTLQPPKKKQILKLNFKRQLAKSDDDKSPETASAPVVVVEQLRQVPQMPQEAFSVEVDEKKAPCRDNLENEANTSEAKTSEAKTNEPKTSDSDNEIIERMWEEIRTTHFGFAVLCPNCGGGSAAFCLCARLRFRPTPAEINTARQRYETQAQNALHAREMQLENELRKLRAQIRQHAK